MFCSTSNTRHLLRGAAALVLLSTTLAASELPAWLRIAAAGGALLLMRGCPMCWLIGLFETVARQAKHGHPPLSISR